VAPAYRQAVLTWMGVSTRPNLYYALVSSGGAVVTPPQIFHTSSATNPYVMTSYTGFGNTSNPAIITYDVKVYLPLITR